MYLAPSIDLSQSGAEAAQTVAGRRTILVWVTVQTLRVKTPAIVCNLELEPPRSELERHANFAGSGMFDRVM